MGFLVLMNAFSSRSKTVWCVNTVIQLMHTAHESFSLIFVYPTSVVNISVLRFAEILVTFVL